ncbi:MAG: carbamoyltransferase [Phycisphaerae bacterium]|jgi:carbamoyltransferase
MTILGLSCYYHDAAAALVRDGRVVAAAEEERFTRRKHDSEFPRRAIDYCLAAGGVSPGEVEHVVFYEKPLLKFDRLLQTILADWPWSLGVWLRGMPLWLTSRLRVGHTIQKELGMDGAPLYGQHHLSHAASAFLVSPFDRAAIITADGVGEWATAAWGVGAGLDIDIRQELRFPHSIGLLFSAVTAYLGFRVNDAEWKVMGLAPYGRPRYVDRFREVVDVRDDGSIRLNPRYFAFTYSTSRTFTRAWERLFGRPMRPRETELDEFHADLAASGQKVIEDIMLRMARHVHRQTGLPHLCLAGGVALNCVANWRILQESGFREVFIQPAAGDSGGALGAALYVYHTVLRNARRWVMNHALLGPSYSDEEIGQALDRLGADYRRFDDSDALLDAAAALIEAGKVIGWFQGRMEYGPRALGARSLLADPRNPEMKAIINAKVKFREAFRPFAPAVLKEEAHRFFEMPAGMDAPFMLLTPLVRAEARAILPAVTHQDGTARVQTVTEEVHPLFYRLIRRFGQRTGVPVLLNTSFNVRGEPIVCTPEDAYNTFVNTGIDALVIGPYLLAGKPGQVDYHKGRQRSIELETRPRGQVL